MSEPAAPSASMPAFDEQWDVVVVGFGAAGASAAIEARRAGASVLVIDRFRGGGATARSGGIVYLGGGTPLQRAAGYDDSPDNMFAYLRAELGEEADSETLRRFCDSSLELASFLDELGVPMPPSGPAPKASYPPDECTLYFSGNERCPPFSNHAEPVPRGHRVLGRGLTGHVLFSGLRRGTIAAGAEVRLQTRACALVEDEAGRVAGVEVATMPRGRRALVHRLLERIVTHGGVFSKSLQRWARGALTRHEDRHGRRRRIGVRGGVVLAAGGFVYHREMVRAEAPAYARAMALGTAGDDGSGIALGRSLGAATRHLDRCTAWRFIDPPTPFPQGILVSREGTRITNEEYYGSLLSRHMAEAHDGEGFLVIDARIARAVWSELVSKPKANFQTFTAIVNLLVNREKADSIEALARAVGLDPEGLCETVDRYNEAARKGGPDEMGKAESRLFAIEEPPFMAIDCSLASKLSPAPCLTLGGLRTEGRHSRVEREDGTIIEGLYSAGRNAAGICSSSYVSGLSISDCLFSGRNAGRHAATRASRPAASRDATPVEAEPPSQALSKFVALLLSVCLGALLAGAPLGEVRAQTPAAQILSDADEMGPAEPAQPDLATRLEAARLRLDAAERANASGVSSSNVALLERLVFVLEQHREAARRHQDLLGEEKRMRDAGGPDPQSFFSVPPPFTVPLLDGVLSSWQAQRNQEDLLASVLEDTRDALRQYERRLDETSKALRLARDGLERETSPTKRLEREAEVRRLSLEEEVGFAQVDLMKVQVENAKLDLDLQKRRTATMDAARDWVESQLAPKPEDLEKVIERLDRARFDLERELEAGRSRLVAAEGRLRAAEQRANEADDGQTIENELEARKRQFNLQQRTVTLQTEWIARLSAERESWERRYQVLDGSMPIASGHEWIEDARKNVEALGRQRRIDEARLAELRLDLSNLVRDLSRPEGVDAAKRRSMSAEMDDLESMITLYERDLASLQESIDLENRLLAELGKRMDTRSLAERIASAREQIDGLWSYEVTSSDGRPITLGKIVIGLVFFVVGYLFSRLVSALLGRRFFPRIGFDSGASTAFQALTFYALLAIAFLMALRLVNIPLTAFAVAGGAIAIGIGFGSQTLMSNFISGLLLLAERPIKAGDLIEVGEAIGTVESIGLRSTRVRTPDNYHIIVPNSAFLESNVINWTHSDMQMRLKIVVGVAYGSPARRVEALLNEAMNSHPRVMRTPEPYVVFADFGNDALIFEGRFWISYTPTTDRLRIQSDIRFAIEQTFAENGIVIAFPQRDVHLDTPNPIRVEIAGSRDDLGPRG